MAKHRTHNPGDLDDALEHVVYEMWKYKQSIWCYGPILQAGGDAAIEFRVLHHRVLLEFFYGPAKHEDNIVAWEYIGNWQQTHPSAALSWLGNYMTRCHTLLAHVSKTRTDMAKAGLKNWGKEWPAVEAHLDQLISEFIYGLSNDHKVICRGWTSKWSAGPFACNDSLKDLVAMLA
jgi:hypothetical protein